MQTSDDNDEQRVMQIESNWIDAFVKGDTETLDRVLAEDFIFTDPQGNILTKSVPSNSSPSISTTLRCGSLAIPPP